MISRDLLGRARAALAVSKNGGPGVEVLRELVEAVEADWPRVEGKVGVSVSPRALPALVYVGIDRHVMLSNPAVDLESEDAPSRVELRVMQALAEHAIEVVGEALHRQ